MARHKNVDWNLPDSPSWDTVRVAVLMDIRDQMQKLNRVFECANFLDIPNRLTRIGMHTLSASDKLDAIRKQTNRIPPRRKRRVTRRQGDV